MTSSTEQSPESERTDQGTRDQLNRSFIDRLASWQEADQVVRSRPHDSLDQALDAFLLDAEARQLSPRTIHYYGQQLHPFLVYLRSEHITTPSAITAHHVRSFLVSLQRRGLKESSVHAAARAIRAFCNFMDADDLIESNPMHKVRMPRLPKTIPAAFTVEDFNRLLAHCTHPRDCAIVLTLIETGCRAAEFVALDIRDIDLGAGRVHIRRGKGKRERITFIGRTTISCIESYFRIRERIEMDDPLWLSFTTQDRLTDSGLRQLLRRLGRRAGVKRCHPHTFRRSFALWSLRAGMNIYALQRIMGHSDLAILKQYLALTEQDLQTAHRQFGTVDQILSQ